jgi:alkanesulfonate monooxygenase SsuD/methylene tetrahydromethanopterin reductase-like flavin-dependent oxidoreductase (luciferase family)
VLGERGEQRLVQQLVVPPAALLQVARAAQHRALAPRTGPPSCRPAPRARDFAARYADAVFAIQPHLESTKALYDDIKRGAVEAGRSPAACKMLFRVQPIVGTSRAEATDKQAEHKALVPLEGGLAILSSRLDFDQLTLPLNKGDWPIARSPSCSACRRAIAR